MEELETDDSLQFDKADFEDGDGGLACVYCKLPIFDNYYEVNGQTSCEGCRHQVEDMRADGSDAVRLVKALVFGSIGGFIGAAVYFGIAALTGYEFGLIAIGVGILVGMGVRLGSGGGGGRGYQFLAAGITYLAIVSTYVPFIIQGLMEEEPAAIVQTDKGAAIASEASAAPSDLAHGDPAASAEATEMGVLGFLIALVLLGLLAMAAPFLALFDGVGAVMGLIIIGIGVHQAWRLNEYQPLEVEGPFQVGTQPNPSGPRLTFGSVD